MRSVYSGALCALAILGVALVAGVWTQTTADHDKIVSCYLGTWGFYRSVPRTHPW